jgi:hypothetical protein
MAKAWRRVLAEEQRRAWNAAAAKVRSRPRLWQSGWLTGQTHFAGINSARARIGREMLLWPPERVVFGPSPVEGLSISEEQGRLRLRVRVVGPVIEDIMVFGAAPCSAGRKKWRHGAYLGLLSAPVGGESDITELYVERYGEPEPGKRVFIRTRQQRSGWEDDDKDISEVAPVSQGGTAARRRGRGGMLLGLNELHGLHGLHREAVAGRVGQRCTREQYRGSPIPAPWQCRTGEGCARAVRKVGPVRRLWALGEVRWSGHWRELWHGT